VLLVLLKGTKMAGRSIIGDVLMKLQNSSFVLMMAVESSMGLKDPSIFI
jgi:hypothetical protein